LLSKASAVERAHGSDAIRDLIPAPSCRAQHPRQGEPALESCFSRSLYNGRNAVERTFCRLKDYRRIATRNDQPANTFLGAIYLVAAVTWWSGVLIL
jgi:transposase